MEGIETQAKQAPSTASFANIPTKNREHRTKERTSALELIFLDLWVEPKDTARRQKSRVNKSKRGGFQKASVCVHSGGHDCGETK